jgi:hypothetical protein
MLRQPAIERIVEQLLVLGPDVERDRQTPRRIDATAGGVERQLSDRDAHPVGAQIAETEDSLSIGHHDCANRAVRPVLHDS